jgi:hypothetical protein
MVVQLAGLFASFRQPTEQAASNSRSLLFTYRNIVSEMPRGWWEICGEMGGGEELKG